MLRRAGAISYLAGVVTIVVADVLCKSAGRDHRNGDIKGGKTFVRQIKPGTKCAPFLHKV